MSKLYLIGTMQPKPDTTIEIYESADGKERFIKSLQKLPERELVKITKKG